MEIEIVDFYPEAPTKKGEKSGTLHIYIIDLDLDIRGIRFIKTKKEWIMRMPHKQAIEDGKKVFYPVITFTNIEVMKKLLTQIKEKGVAYINEVLKTK